MNGLTDHYRGLKSMYLNAPINREAYSGVRIHIEAGRAEITHNVNPTFFHAAESLHGSVYFKMLDDAAFFAASSIITDEFLFTISFQIQLLRPVKTGSLFAAGWVEKPGKSIIIAQSSILNDAGKRVALGQGQFMKSGKSLIETKGYKI